MSCIDIDITKFNKCIEDLDKQIDKYNKNIEDYFKYIERIPYETKEWQSSVATNFVNNNVLPKKKYYTDYGDSLELLTSKMKNCSEILNKSKDSLKYGE